MPSPEFSNVFDQRLLGNVQSELCGGFWIAEKALQHGQPGDLEMFSLTEIRALVWLSSLEADAPVLVEVSQFPANRFFLDLHESGLLV